MELLTSYIHRAQLGAAICLGIALVSALKALLVPATPRSGRKWEVYY